MAKREDKSPVIIRVPRGSEKTAENLRLYLVDTEGAVIESVSLKGGEVKLKTSSQNIKANAKVYIAPELPADVKDITITEKKLINMGAWQPSFRLPPNNISQIPFFPPFPFPLPFGWCNITGIVTKTFNVNGVPEVLPICDAKVHICDVERIWFIINRIPDAVLNDLRHRLQAVIKLPIPIPDPGPERTINLGRLATAAAPLAQARALAAELPTRPELPSHVQNSVLTGSLESFRASIVNNFGLYHPYLCWWPWFWPWFYECEEIATVTTDCNGRFDYNMLYFLNNHPNVYVWVEVLINGCWVTVYRPWISCNTYWNYACGTDINISVTNPDILPCTCHGDSIDDDHVWIENVNYGTSIRHIQQSATPSGHLANAVGLTAYGGYGNISPFAKSFPFVVQFGDGLNAMGVTYYRWSYQQRKDAYLTNVPDTRHIIGGDLAKSYNHWIQVTPTDWENLPGSVTLGPFLDSSNRVMYKVPHLDAAVDSGVAGAFWNADTASVNINTNAWNPGLYEFTLELLDNNGNVVPLNANPFKVDRLGTDPAPVPPGLTTIDADGLAENYVIKNIAGKTIGFKFLMRVDNDYCYGGIADALVDGNSTDTECGTGYYDDKNNDNVDLFFEAGHPHNFAVYSFSVYKGNSGALAFAGSSGASANANNVIPPAMVTTGDNVYDISLVDIPVPAPPLPPNPVHPVSHMDQYHKSIPVRDMLGTCTMAAFSENLYVTGTQTNGNTTLLGFDANYVAAIAIAPNS
ncbi:hypothetical protein [Mucilaginibacter sp.]|jgi:hypothetical protein|uniref:hypothetical protein n=1 Tax=Mucilaginibacter sp. TaxID=1882438 RepID=UPI002BBDECBF|nr:hypothetical protein [Mucilaginibacter sp.]HTI59917.1 hypothetical protein [Mucilaginibacter sp.]